MGSLVRLARRASAIAAVLALIAVTPIAANELGASSPSAGFTLHDADETLRDYCALDDQGRLWLTLPGGTRWELVTSTADPAVANPGDGAFHPFDPAEVRAALDEIRCPLDGVDAEIFLLPFPRRAGLESAAGPGLILLSPGVAAIAREHQHAQLAHELGHVYQYRHLPDGDANGWQRYRALRGITDESQYGATSVHANRPHEIFAEDFRALFGGALANYSGTIENGELVPPALVPGLDRFLIGLSEREFIAALSAWPSPSSGPVRFSIPRETDAPLDLFDASGRRIATLEGRRSAAGSLWSWSGASDDGRLVHSGVVFARVRETHGETLRLVVAR